MKKNYLVKTLVALCATMVLLTTVSFTALADPDLLEVWTDKDVYIPGEYVMITARVTDGGVGVKDVKVCYTVCSPVQCYPGICAYTNSAGEVTFAHEIPAGLPLNEMGEWYAHVTTETGLAEDVYFDVVSIRLTADKDQVPAQTGGTVTLTLEGGNNYAGRGYAILGGVTGTSPGTPLPLGFTTLPINWDPFTDLVMSFWNVAFFMNFLGNFDGAGTATASLVLPPLPDYVGLKMYYAATVYNLFDGVSNPIDVTLI